jgi:thioesterase domain-containing protein
VTAPKNVEDIYPLSPMQHLMLLHAMSAPGNGVLLNQVSYDVRGPLDVERFRRAWEIVVARHAALRTAFLWEGLAQPLQVVREAVIIPFRVVDLSAMDPVAQSNRVDDLRREDLETPLPLAQAPLMRVTLARINERRHCFIWSIHHLVIDRWSHAIVFGDLQAIYRASLNDQPLRLSPPGRFRDYIEWIAQQDVATAADFWRNEFAGIHVPTLTVGSGPPSGRRTQTAFTLSFEETSALRVRSAAWRTTPATILLAAIGLRQVAHDGTAEAVLGVTVSGRPPEVEDTANIVGSFVNNLPAPISLVPARRVCDWIRDLQRAQARRQSVAHVSLADIHGWSGWLAARPLFEMLVLINLTDEADVEWPGLEFVPIGATLDAGYRFMLSATVANDSIVLTLVHHDSFIGGAQLLDEVAGFIRRIASAGDDTTVAELLPAGAPLNLSSNGERSRSADSRHQQSAHHAANGGKPTVGSSNAVLLQVWRDILGIETIGPDDDFFALGGTSLQAAQLFARIEGITGAALPLSTLLRARTVRALLEEIGNPLPPSGALVRIRSSGRRDPLYVVPGIEGNVVGLSGLAEGLGPDQPIGAFESPGLRSGETPLTTIEAIAGRYVSELLPTATKPFHLLGICWGAAVAFEMARQLTAGGRPPASVMLMEPAVLFREGAEAPPRFGAAAFVRSRLELYLDEFRKAGWRERSSMIKQKVRRAAQLLGGADDLAQTRTELNQERVRTANLAALVNYRRQQYDGRACIFVTGERDLHGRSDYRLEWASLLTPRPDVVPIAGINTNDALSAAHVQVFANSVRKWIDLVADQRSARNVT